MSRERGKLLAVVVEVHDRHYRQTGATIELYGGIHNETRLGVTLRLNRPESRAPFNLGQRLTLTISDEESP